MYNGIQKIEAVIDEIEENITARIDYEALASRMALSVYEFRRIFSFIVGCPISEYVRKRRLSLAACELMSEGGVSIKALSEKYGYSTEAAFSKAFREMHGASPVGCQKGECEIKLFTRPRLEFSVSGRSTIPFTVIKDKKFGIKGLSSISPLTDTCCCDAVWKEFYYKGYDKAIRGEKIYASYRSLMDGVLCTIGERIAAEDIKECDEQIGECNYASFKMNTTSDDEVNKKYGEILYEFLPSAGFKQRIDAPTVEVFPADMDTEGFEWEIRIPIENI